MTISSLPPRSQLSQVKEQVKDHVKGIAQSTADAAVGFAGSSIQGLRNATASVADTAFSAVQAGASALVARGEAIERGGLQALGATTVAVSAAAGTAGVAVALPVLTECMLQMLESFTSVQPTDAQRQEIQNLSRQVGPALGGLMGSAIVYHFGGYSLRGVGEVAAARLEAVGPNDLQTHGRPLGTS